jgi:hypothetical protein
LFQAIGKAPAVKLVLKYAIALVIKHACHGASPWPDQKAFGKCCGTAESKSSRIPT